MDWQVVVTMLHDRMVLLTSFLNWVNVNHGTGKITQMMEKLMLNLFSYSMSFDN